MDYLEQMWGGPAQLRFLVQPLLAVLLGIRDGSHDAKEGRPPYIWALLRDAAGRRGRLTEALKRLAIPMAVGIAMSLILQWVVRNRVHLATAALYGVLFIGLPYAVARALSNRAVKALLRHRSLRAQA